MLRTDRKLGTASTDGQEAGRTGKVVVGGNATGRKTVPSCGQNVVLRSSKQVNLLNGILRLFIFSPVFIINPLLILIGRREALLPF